MVNVIHTANLTKRFGNLVALDGIQISISRGEIFGLLGPNAAGKSTMIRILAGILNVDEGDSTVLGYNLITESEKIKVNIGYVAQSFALYPELTVAENLEFYSSIYPPAGKGREELLLKEYGLESFSCRKAGLLSGGYKRRLSIVCALVHDPDVIFLDEPTAGIDPVTRKELWERFYDLAARGKTLFVTTHYMEEAERCNSLAFLHHGRVVAQGSPASIIASFTDRTVYTISTMHNADLAADLLLMPEVQALNQFGDHLRVITDESVDVELLEEMVSRHCGGEAAVLLSQAGIEDVFIVLTHERGEV